VTFVVGGLLMILGAILFLVAWGLGGNDLRIAGGVLFVVGDLAVTFAIFRSR
jgi:hypothetical protein